MKRFSVLVFLVVFALAGCGGPRQYTKVDLQKRGALELTGVVSVQSTGSFKLLDDSGNEVHLRTGQLTQYMPQGYRSLEGDRVRVSYQHVAKTSGKGIRAVLQLEALNIPEKNKSPATPVSGVIRSSRNGWINILPDGLALEDLGMSFKARNTSKVTEGSKKWVYGDNSWTFPVGKRVKVDFVREPLLRGNGYYLKIVKAEILADR